MRGAESEAASDFKVADSVTAFSAADLVALGAANIADLAAFTPNLEIVTAGATTPTFFIRGVGLNDFNANSTGAVAVYADDVALNAPALQLGTLFDMESVNVLRGPQGSGLARNSSAGAIKLYTRKPTGQFNGYLRAEGGNFNHEDYEGAIEAPIFEEILSARIGFRFQQRDGTMRNRCGSAPPYDQRAVMPDAGVRAANRQTDRDPPWSLCGEQVLVIVNPDSGLSNVSEVPPGLEDWVNNRNNWAARGTLRFEPTLETSFLLGFHGARRDELSRLGQSYGVTGNYCLNGDVNNCAAVQAFPNGARINNLLGGNQGTTGYIAPEVIRRMNELAPCYNNAFNLTITCGPPVGTNPSFVQLDNARRQVANELARNLDERPWSGDFDFVGDTTNDVYGMYLKSEILLPFEIDLTSTTGYDTYNRAIGLDLDQSPETLFHIRTKDHGHQYTQDISFAGEHEIIPESPVRWEVGGYGLSEKLKIGVNNDLGILTVAAVSNRAYEQNVLSLGGYGQFGFDFWDDFTLDGGVRWNFEKKKIDYQLEDLGQPLALNERDTWRAPTGILKLTYRFNEDTHVYWKYNRGWKPGHYNATGSRIQQISIADPETIDAFETGLRAEFFGGILSGDASLFYYNYADYQIFTAQQFAGSGPEFVILNANDAEVYGAEIDALIRPWVGAFVNVRFGWLETQFLDFTLLQQQVIARSGQQITINRELQNSGNPLLNSPRFKVSISAEQLIPLGRYGYLAPRYDGAWSDDTYYDATKGRGIPNNQGITFLPKLTIGQRAYWLHGARLAYRTPDGRLEVAGWVRNIENKATKTFAFDGSTFQRTTIYYVNDPRTFGGTVTVTF